jgi:ubiquinone/menaquinone biosynthesis C-methylase UbiE
MLERILEPEVMDTTEEALDYDSMDHSEVNRKFSSEFLEVWDGRGPILDVGTGTAQIPIELCRQYQALGTTSDPRFSGLWTELRIVAIDLADHMLARARVNVERAGLSVRIAIEKADAKAFRYTDGHFGAIISNSIIHHIPEPFSCVAEMHRVCAPGGTLFIRDLLRPDDLAALRNIVDTYAACANEHQRKMFGDSLHAALTLAEVRELVCRLGYEPESVTQTTDRHWTFATLRH